MTAHELRIGNLILTPKEKREKPFLRSIVKEIHTDSIVVEGDRTVRLEDCDGIPLTEDLLRKYAFTGSAELSLTLESGLKIIARPNTGGTWSICGISAPESKDYSFTGFFSQVHQLQNLYYMLKNEEIKFTTA